MTSPIDWARAFARQACSDFDAYDQLLAVKSLPACHQLHYLQMAMEKAVKAHLIAGGADPLDVQASHKYIAKNVPTIVRNSLSRTPGAKAGWIMDAVHRLARRIELLHPQVNDAGSVPSNCEYPWKDAAGQIVVPANHDFGLRLHEERAATLMIKEVRIRAIEIRDAP